MVQNYARKIDYQLARSLASRGQIQEAFSFIEATHDEATAELIRICEIPAPPFKEGARAEYIKNCFEKLGLTGARFDEEGNVIAERRGVGENPNLIVSAHLDTVFP